MIPGYGTTPTAWGYDNWTYAACCDSQPVELSESEHAALVALLAKALGNREENSK